MLSGSRPNSKPALSPATRVDHTGFTTLHPHFLPEALEGAAPPAGLFPPFLSSQAKHPFPRNPTPVMSPTCL